MVQFNPSGGIQKGRLSVSIKPTKGAHNYYPLFCTLAQVGQFFDVYQRLLQFS